MILKKSNHTFLLKLYLFKLIFIIFTYRNAEELERQKTARLPLSDLGVAHQPNIRLMLCPGHNIMK